MLPTDVDEYRVIDTETHVIEPYDLWTSRLCVDKWGDKVPHVSWDEERQEDASYFGTQRVGAAASAAQAGWAEYPPDHPPSLDVVDRATWDAQARLAKMDEYGISAQVLYPNVAGSGAGKVLAIGDPELMLACVQADNDFLTEFASTDPNRFVAIAALPFWTWSSRYGDRSLHRDGTQGSDHDGRTRALGNAQAGRPLLGPDVGQGAGGGPVDQLPHRLARHVDLRHRVRGRGSSCELRRVRCAVRCGEREGDRGPHHWRCLSQVPRAEVRVRRERDRVVPFALEHLDWQWKNCGVAHEHPEYEILPSEYFLRQMYTAAVEPRQFIAETLGELPEDVLCKILHDNAAALYHID